MNPNQTAEMLHAAADTCNAVANAVRSLARALDEPEPQVAWADDKSSPEHDDGAHQVVPTSWWRELAVILDDSTYRQVTNLMAAWGIDQADDPGPLTDAERQWVLDTARGMAGTAPGDAAELATDAPAGSYGPGPAPSPHPRHRLGGRLTTGAPTTDGSQTVRVPEDPAPGLSYVDADDRWAEGQEPPR